MTETYQKQNLRTITIPLRNINICTDPQKMEDLSSVLVNRQIHRSLMRFNGNNEVCSDLAESYAVTQDGLSFTFTLGNFYFSDGSQLSAHDVVKTFRRIRTVNPALAGDLHSIINFEDGSLDSSIGVQAVSELCVQFSLSKPDPLLLKLLASTDLSIIKLDENLNLLPASIGKYVLETDPELKLSLRQEFDNEKAPLHVHFRAIENDDDATKHAKDGVIDCLEPFDIHHELKSRLLSIGWHQFLGPVTRLLFISMNKNSLTFEERQNLFTIFYEDKHRTPHDRYNPTYGLIPSNLDGALEKEDALNLVHVCTKAARKRISIASPGTQETRTLTTWMSEMLHRKGFEIDIFFFSFKQYFEVINSGKFDLILRSKFLDYPDGMSIFSYFKSTSDFKMLSSSSKELDHLIDQARFEINLAERVKLYKTIQNKILMHYELVPLFTGSNQSFLWSDKISSIEYHPMGFHSLNFSEIQLR